MGLCSECRKVREFLSKYGRGVALGLACIHGIATGEPEEVREFSPQRIEQFVMPAGGTASIRVGSDQLMTSVFDFTRRRT